ncbi:NUDIX hydrolase [Devosia sediminis]|uniref:NUDIX domain-containing protein n=1 Tax=Devosia sediminis TaxID=2798801 RepID=A0A934J262_9HYPH|nr:NUDIX domain-containing protein [Devosia sediminis]MBJ3786868.1 NUDIX domain-containing protein [Devosia sediminis]
MSARHVISFPIDGQRFNFRVAGIIVAEGHVLVCREDDDAYCMLPGGRVELGEDSRLSLGREIAEELDMPAEIGAMVATSESFYRREEQDFHEVGFFYAVTLPGQAPDGKTPWLKRFDEGHDLSFYWLPLTGNALEEFNLLPGWLPGFLRDLPAELTHVIHDERPA